MRRWRRGAGVLALAAAVLVTAVAVRVQADGDDEPPAETDRVVKIGPQAVVIVDELGDARMYDDPSQQAPDCRATADCWGMALQLFAGFAVLTYEDITTSTDGSSSALGARGAP
jgi:hypothetical protein